MEAREREEYDAGGNKGFGGTSNEDTVFPNDEIRNHDDRTSKYHNNILGGAVNEDDYDVTKNEEEQENSEEDLDTLATAQQEEADALASLATAN